LPAADRPGLGRLSADSLGDRDMRAPDWLTKNRAMWDAMAPVHLAAPGYDLPGFKAGRSSLQAHEIADLGDVAGRDLVHLQCHIGLDTLSWARRGARVTGVDFSSVSIEAARALADELGLDARFVVSDVYAAAQTLGRAFDVVYTGVGALCWLPDMTAWARVVRDLLKPGGELYLFEFHPVEWMLGCEPDGALSLRFDYFTPPEGYREPAPLDYAGAGETRAFDNVQWNHPLGEVVTALVQAGLRITSLREMGASVLRTWPGMEATPDGMFRMGLGRPSAPLMYVLRATRP
jgi:SAM-dependent methyltransferase